MLFHRFLKDCRAGVAPLLALGAIPLFGSVGAAIDYSRANYARAAMQAALDAAAVMLSKEAQQLSDSQLTQKASDYFNANFVHPEVQKVAVTAVASSVTGGTSVTMSATASVPTEFMGLMGFSKLAVSVNSGVVAVADGLGCVLSLDRSASGAITGQGGTSVALSGCSLYDNSRNAAALTVGGSASISALSVGVVGGVSGSNGITTTQGIKTGIGPVADPYADVSFPNFFGCNQHNYHTAKTETIDPGVYCGGIKVDAGANVTLNPGIYYLDGGSFSVNGNATVTGTGVTLVFTAKTNSDFATATINGTGSVNLTPPKSGPTAGIVIFGDRRIPVGTTFNFTGGANQYLGGAVYVPTGAVNFSGGAGTSTNCTQVIGNTVSFAGNSSLVLNCSNYSVRPFSPLSVKLTS